jgi:acetyltransferase-like isoleucine patch superfamily enzyme
MLDYELLNRFVNSADGDEELFSSLSAFIKNLPFSDSARNTQIRRDIVIRIASLFLADDERAALLNLPAGCRIREGAKILAPENLIIGEDCWIGENAILDAQGGLEIGRCTSIGLGVFVWSHSGHLANLSNQNEIGSSKIIRKKTVIGSNCFIGGPSVILPGVTIGDKCVIRPLSLIDRDLPNRTVV